MSESFKVFHLKKREYLKSKIHFFRPIKKKLMNSTIKTTGLSFIAGLAGAAIWTQFFFANPEHYGGFR